MCAAVLALLVLASAGGCSGACESHGRTFEDGEYWTCNDGCNACSCINGTVNKTLIDCSGPPNPAANKLSCKDGDLLHPHGTEWTCDHGCGTCACDDGRIESDPDVCSAGTDSGS